MVHRRTRFPVLVASLLAQQARTGPSLSSHSLAGRQLTVVSLDALQTHAYVPGRIFGPVWPRLCRRLSSIHLDQGAMRRRLPCSWCGGGTGPSARRCGRRIVLDLLYAHQDRL